MVGFTIFERVSIFSYPSSQNDDENPHPRPRGDFTLIALANTDKTFTVTLFAPFELFEKELHDSSSQIIFFRRHFPDALDLLGERHVIETFERVGRPSALVIQYLEI